MPRGHRWVARALSLAVAGLGISWLLVDVARRALEAADPIRAAFALIGLAGLFVLAFAVWVGYSVYWAKARRLAAQLQKLHPTSKVIAVRLPRAIAGETIEFSTETSTMTMGALVAERAGVSLWRPGTAPQLVTRLAWDAVGAVIAAEYVESGIAFEGIAVLDLNRSQAIVMQVARFVCKLAWNPDSARLSTIAAQLEASRPDLAT